MDEGPDLVLAADFRRELTGMGTYKPVLTWQDLENESHLPGVDRLREMILRVVPPFARPIPPGTIVHTGVPSAPGTKKYLLCLGGRPDRVITLVDHGGGRWTHQWLFGPPVDIPLPEEEEPPQRYIDV